MRLIIVYHLRELMYTRYVYVCRYIRCFEALSFQFSNRSFCCSVRSKVHLQISISEPVITTTFLFLFFFVLWTSLERSWRAVAGGLIMGYHSIQTNGLDAHSLLICISNSFPRQNLLFFLYIPILIGLSTHNVLAIPDRFSLDWF